MKNEFTLCTATLGMKRKTAFFFLLPLFPKPRLSLGQGEMELAAHGDCALSCDQHPGKGCPRYWPVLWKCVLHCLFWVSDRSGWNGTMYGVERLCGKVQ